MRHLRFRLVSAALVFSVLFLCLSLFGCANAPRFTHDQCNATRFGTAAEHENCLRAAAKYEQEQHEKEDKRLIRRDKLIIFLNACDAHARFVVYEKRHGRSCLPNKRQQRKAMREYGYKYTHDNVRKCANRNHILCVDPYEILEQMKVYY